jgi:hypothetical protein
MSNSRGAWATRPRRVSRSGNRFSPRFGPGRALGRTGSRAPFLWPLRGNETGQGSHAQAALEARCCRSSEASRSSPKIYQAERVRNSPPTRPIGRRVPGGGDPFIPQDARRLKQPHRRMVCPPRIGLSRDPRCRPVVSSPYLDMGLPLKSAREPSFCNQLVGLLTLDQE